MSQATLYQRFEAGLGFILCVYLYLHLGYSLILFILFLFSVDIVMLGYLINRSLGAHLYNLGHAFIFPPLLIGLGIATRSNVYIAAGLIWAAHIGWDRAFGYGLKFLSGFQDTHLGHIGKQP